MPNSEVISISDEEEDSARDKPHMDKDSEEFYGEDDEEIDELDPEEYVEAVPPQWLLMLRIPACSRVVADHARPVKSRSHEQAERHSSPDQRDVVYNAPQTPPNRKRQRSPITPGGPVRKHRARDAEERASQVAQSTDHPLHKYTEEMRRDEESDEESTRTPIIKGEDSASASQSRHKPGRPSKP
ncbi:hypothetical protein EWM64_g4949 [Hericium alpestre]|uniref:Uncharacterized protein n=1 Tax=Hericium alpestre TaxID=135208 RepID=A0A4Y9ZYF1_9AGAM|nr:hypothetical protein EWM64_g4949 [Hericium alpestre]